MTEGRNQLLNFYKSEAHTNVNSDYQQQWRLQENNRFSQTPFFPLGITILNYFKGQS